MFIRSLGNELAAYDQTAESELLACLLKGETFARKFDNCITALETIDRFGMNRTSAKLLTDRFSDVTAFAATHLGGLGTNPDECAAIGRFCTEGLAAAARKTIETIRQWLANLWAFFKRMVTAAQNYFDNSARELKVELSRVLTFDGDRVLVQEDYAGTIVKRLSGAADALTKMHKAFSTADLTVEQRIGVLHDSTKSLAKLLREPERFPDPNEAATVVLNGVFSTLSDFLLRMIFRSWTANTANLEETASKEDIRQLAKTVIAVADTISGYKNYDKPLAEANRRLVAMVGQDEVDSDSVKELRDSVSFYSNATQRYSHTVRLLCQQTTRFLKKLEPVK